MFYLVLLYWGSFAQQSPTLKILSQLQDYSQRVDLKSRCYTWSKPSSKHHLVIATLPMLGWLLGLCAQANILMISLLLNSNKCVYKLADDEAKGFFDLPKHPVAHAVSPLWPRQCPVPPTLRPRCCIMVRVFIQSTNNQWSVIQCCWCCRLYFRGDICCWTIKPFSFCQTFRPLVSQISRSKLHLLPVARQAAGMETLHGPPQLTTDLALNVSSPCTGNATPTSESISPLGMLKHEMHSVGRVSMLPWCWVGP